VRNKRTTEELQKELRWLKEQFARIIPRIEHLEAKVQKETQVEITLADGQRVKCSTADERDLREYDDLMKLLFEYGHKKRQIELWLSPPKGRPKGRRNERPKPVDPTIASALAFHKTPEGQTSTLMKLAQKFSGFKTRAEWKKWVYRFKKASTEARQSQA